MLDRLTLAQRLWIWAFVATALFYTAVGLGWFGLFQAKETLRAVHEERLEALSYLDAIQQALRDNRRLVLLAFQHDPEGGLASAHERSLSYYLDRIDENRRKVEGLLGEHTRHIRGEADSELFKVFLERYEDWDEHLTDVLSFLQIEQFHVWVMSTFVKAGEPAGEEADLAIAALYAHFSDETKKDHKVAQVRYEHTVWIFLALAVFGGVTGSLLAISTLRRLRTAFRVASGVAKSIAAGDLSCPVPRLGSDEFGQLLGDIGLMRDNLHRLIDDLRREVERLGAQARQMSSIAVDASTHADAQADALNRMAAAAAELVQSIDEIEAHAETSIGSTERSVVRAEESQSFIRRMAEEMDHAAQVVTDAATQVRELEGLAQRISGVVQIIREVAEQTNLLALNAAIEAARAGEQGRGFAVVADEVRKLAERTSSSTQVITASISDIQRYTRNVSAEMTRVVDRVQSGAALASEADGSVAEIRAGTTEVHAASASIGKLIQEQASSTREIVSQIEGVSSGTSELSRRAGSSAEAAEGLNEISEILDDLSGRFKLA